MSCKLVLWKVNKGWFGNTTKSVENKMFLAKMWNISAHNLYIIKVGKWVVNCNMSTKTLSYI